MNLVKFDLVKNKEFLSRFSDELKDLSLFEVKSVTLEKNGKDLKVRLVFDSDNGIQVRLNFLIELSDFGLILMFKVKVLNSKYSDETPYIIGSAGFDEDWVFKFMRMTIARVENSINKMRNDSSGSVELKLERFMKSIRLEEHI